MEPKVRNSSHQLPTYRSGTAVGNVFMLTNLSVPTAKEPVVFCQPAWHGREQMPGMRRLAAPFYSPVSGVGKYGPGNWLGRVQRSYLARARCSERR